MRSIAILAFFFCLPVALTDISLSGYRFESEDVVYDVELNTYKLPKDYPARLRIFGQQLSTATKVLFTSRSFSYNETCDSMDHSRSFDLKSESEDFATAEIQLESGTNDEKVFYMCIRDQYGNYIHLGEQSRFIVYYKSDQLMPLPLQIGLVCLCLFLSSIFSGLNLGLMSLDVSELKLIIRCGSPLDKKYATTILPIRKRGNTLLCTLLFGNTIVNAGLTLMLDNLIGQGIFALVGSTVGILIFGEIVPQSICSRYGLRVGYYCRFIVLFFMYGLFPITFSIGKLLDLILGHEIHQVYSRDELREMVKMSFAVKDDNHSDNSSHSSSDGDYDRSKGLLQEEFNIVNGALKITETTVKTIMKDRQDVFMLDVSVSIDYDLIELITNHGYTRIPVYANGDKNNIVGLLSTKDLLGIDPEDKLPLNALIEYYPRTVLRVPESTSILEMLNLFKSTKVHLAIIDRVVNDGERDPISEIVGIVTLENVIEFILDEQIDDEADAQKEERMKQEKAETRVTSQKAPLFQRSDIIPQQLNTATVQFLMANVEAFRKELVERKVLANLLRFPNIFIVKKIGGKTKPGDKLLYEADKEAHYFTLILQGSCQVYIGREKLPFEAGPFHYFGLEALIGSSRHSHHDTRSLHSDSVAENGSEENSESEQQRLLAHAHQEHGHEYHDATVTVGINRRFVRPRRGGWAESTKQHPVDSTWSINEEDDVVDHNLTVKSNGSGGSAFSPTTGRKSVLPPRAPSSHGSGLHILARRDSSSSLSSTNPSYLACRKTFTPDFTVELNQDVQYVQLSSSHYRALITVTQLVRRKNMLDNTAFIVDKLFTELLREGEHFPNFKLIGPSNGATESAVDGVANQLALPGSEASATTADAADAAVATASSSVGERGTWNSSTSLSGRQRPSTTVHSTLLAHLQRKQHNQLELPGTGGSNVGTPSADFTTPASSQNVSPNISKQPPRRPRSNSEVTPNNTP